MCLVIDTDTQASIFRRNCPKHGEFRAVLNWIMDGRGKIVYGGKTYISELARSGYLSLFSEFGRLNKLVRVADSKVDEEEARLKLMLQHRDFDDPHILAIINISKCRVVCTNDKRMDKFLKDKAFYKKGVTPVKIYRNRKCADLLCDENIADCCKPTCMLNKAQKVNLPCFG